MSNSLAIATASETLRQLVDKVAKETLPGSGAVLGRPDGADTTPQIRIFLYQVIPNPAWSNADLPMRRGDGSLVQHPQAALDLYYLLTFYGDESQHQPQRLLGRVASVLHAQPFLTREMIRATIKSFTDTDPGHYLGDADLADQVELVKFSPLPLNLEELSKLWSVFFQTPYALSVSFQGSVVLIESKDTPQAALPVRDRNVYVLPFHHPVIQKVVSATGDNDPILPTSTLLIRGQRLRGGRTEVWVGGINLTAEVAELSNMEIKLPLPTPLPAGLYAGVQTVRVLHKIDMGTPPTEHRGVESNVEAFVLRPVVTPTVVGTPASTVVNGVTFKAGEIKVDFNPKVSKSQRVVLLLNEFNPPTDRSARAYSFNALPGNGITGTATEAASVNIAFEKVVMGTYLVRAQVNGAESLLDVDGTGKYVSPQVTI